MDPNFQLPDIQVAWDFRPALRLWSFATLESEGMGVPKVTYRQVLEQVSLLDLKHLTNGAVT